MTRAVRDIRLSQRIRDAVVCPFCHGTLEQRDSAARCTNCDQEYTRASSGALDLRLQRAKNYHVEHTLGSPLPMERPFRFEPLPIRDAPEVDFSGVQVPYHLSKELLSHFPRASAADRLMLDLGCGPANHQRVCEHAGFTWVGLDHESEDAQILGDAHALPFRDACFEFVLSIAVLEHIRHPIVMVREALRVLRPGGTFIGTVAFLEPFHSNSFYHHTHLGTYNSLREGGFDIEHVSPSARWSVLTAQAQMGLFPKMPEFVSKALIAPLYAMHRIWWKLGALVSPDASEETRVRNTTGAFAFVAHKPV